MSKNKKTFRPKARLPRGFGDVAAHEVRTMAAMIKTIGEVYELYGFEPLETPALEFAECLGKFLPDADRPNEGVFALQDDDEQWMSLRYDLTAPTARYVAENYDGLAKPFRRYQVGPVWRNEKPGPGRFRQFVQFDADTIGTTEMAADAELAMMFSDVMEKLGIERGDYAIRMNNRKILDGVLEKINLLGDDEATSNTRLTVMRAMDKLDRLGSQGVRLLLGEGRKDESGDYTKGANLDAASIDKVIAFVEAGKSTNKDTLAALAELIKGSEIGQQGIDELVEINTLILAAGYLEDRICFDPSIVRGLGYYSGPVMEAELTFEIKDEKGNLVRFGSVGGAGRYDGLVARFKGIEVPATGISIGVSRLYAALEKLGKHPAPKVRAPVIISVMDKSERATYQQMAMDLRQAGIRAEVYMGSSGMKAQLKYADKRGAPLVVIQGEDERANDEITIKDLVVGAKASKDITDNQEWRSSQVAQMTAKTQDLVKTVQDILAKPHHRH
ncbi:MAG: histidine--tRNA ligase [Rhizobiales bacterium]|nr:histidine--tRNA ligase [Hyphomicrobiales bacterium]NRB14262.1 histidine--tRNA ligase [Hyphomicrobiales bacterium]